LLFKAACSPCPRPDVIRSRRPALLRLSAKFVQRVLEGGQPNDLPIEQPTKFELAVNLKSAKQIDLRIPEAFLARADALLE
jgi:putative tryptophan/tyrosine transport system substrate-binding protein